MEINIIEFIKGNKNYAEVMAADFIKAALLCTSHNDADANNPL